MATTLSAKKRIRQNAARRARNRWRLRTMRSSLKAFQSAIASGDANGAKDAFRAASRIVDKSAQAGVIHKNQAARRKSRMSARLKRLTQGNA